MKTCPSAFLGLLPRSCCGCACAGAGRGAGTRAGVAARSPWSSLQTMNCLYSAEAFHVVCKQSGCAASGDELRVFYVQKSMCIWVIFKGFIRTGVSYIFSDPVLMPSLITRPTGALHHGLLGLSYLPLFPWDSLWPAFSDQSLSLSAASVAGFSLVA